MTLDRTTKEIYVDVRDWLADEIWYKSADFAFTSLVQVRSKQKALANQMLPEIWRRFQQLHAIGNAEGKGASDRLKMEIGQKALKACFFAQSSYALSLMNDTGVTLNHAMQDSFESLDNYADYLFSPSGNKLPSRQSLKLPLATAIDGYIGGENAHQLPISALQAVTGMTLLALREQTPKYESATLPMPGRALGDVVLWEQPRIR